MTSKQEALDRLADAEIQADAQQEAARRKAEAARADRATAVAALRKNIERSYRSYLEAVTGAEAHLEAGLQSLSDAEEHAADIQRDAALIQPGLQPLTLSHAALSARLSRLLSDSAKRVLNTQAGYGGIEWASSVIPTAPGHWRASEEKELNAEIASITSGETQEPLRVKRRSTASQTEAPIDHFDNI